MYSSAELEFVICFFVFVFVCVCELRAVVQHTQPTGIHWDLLSLLRSGTVFKCCCWSSCMQTLDYQVPTGYTRGPTTYLTYLLPDTTVSRMMLLGDYTVDYRISYSHVIL